jgi:hypothetical protein
MIAELKYANNVPCAWKISRYQRFTALAVHSATTNIFNPPKLDEQVQN